MKRSPDDNLEVLAILHERETQVRSDVHAYARPEFRLGNAVRYCRGEGWPVVVCRSPGELEAAIRTGRPAN